MITTTGKNIIKNYFGGQTLRIADSIALGTGTAPVTLADTALGNEVTRVTISAYFADLANNRIVFKGTIPPNPNDILTITEIGLFRHGEVNIPDALVARVVLGTPKATDANLPTEVEFSLGISV